MLLRSAAVYPCSMRGDQAPGTAALGAGLTFGMRGTVRAPRDTKRPDAGSFLFTLVGLKTCLVNWQNILRTELSTLENVGVGKDIHGIKSTYAKMPSIIFI